jgi:CheY-like chemotaxis protein
MAAARILIIEDNVPNLELVEYLLRSAGYVTLAAWDGAEGVRIAREKRPDLVVCDLQMPLMNGYEVLARILEDPALRTIPLIAVTAFSMPGDADEALAAGFHGYLSKPIEPEKFVAQIEEFLRPDLRAPLSRNGP